MCLWVFFTIRIFFLVWKKGWLICQKLLSLFVKYSRSLFWEELAIVEFWEDLAIENGQVKNVGRFVDISAVDQWDVIFKKYLVKWHRNKNGRGGGNAKLEGRNGAFYLHSPTSFFSSFLPLSFSPSHLSPSSFPFSFTPSSSFFPSCYLLFLLSFFSASSHFSPCSLSFSPSSLPIPHTLRKAVHTHQNYNGLIGIRAMNMWF